MAGNPILDPNASQDTQVGYLAGLNLPSTGEFLSQTENFITEEEDSATARGAGDPFSHWKLPTYDSRIDYFQLVSLAEKFYSFAGGKFMPSPWQLQWANERGMASWDERDIFNWMAGLAGLQQSMPWAAAGMNKTTWMQQSRNLDETVNELTGIDGWDQAGLDPNLRAQALQNNWDSTQLRAHLINDASAMSKYGWIKHGMDYQSFLDYKTQNADKLRQRYGTNVTNNQAVANLNDPLASFNAGGGAFSYAASGQNAPTARQSEIR